jgi:hypothetical protein
MARTTWVALALLVALLPVAACGGGGNGNSEQDRAAKYIESKIEADTGIHSGLSMGGIIVATTDQAGSYLGSIGGAGAVAEQVKVTHVIVSKGDTVANADISFAVRDQDETCTGTAMAQREDGDWSFLTLAIKSCD